MTPNRTRGNRSTAQHHDVRGAKLLGDHIRHVLVPHQPRNGRHVRSDHHGAGVEAREVAPPAHPLRLPDPTDFTQHGVKAVHAGQGCHCVDHVGADLATDAPVGQLHDIVVDCFDEVRVNVDATEVVDDHGGSSQPTVSKQSIQQRRFTRSEVAPEDDQPRCL